jgi:ubiquinone/menaquinone biosynthesis C-methylase UbiE
MTATDDELRRRSWSRYWASGALTSLPEDFRANYDGEIRAFWHARSAEVPDGGQVLDVCTGNGAVALLVAEGLAGQGRSVRITAVDLADIQPARIGQRFPALAAFIERIRFVGNRPFEDIALGDASQDLIVSQYGIEYCEPEAAARQCARLLRPGGRLALITHATDSAMRSTMEQELAQYEAVAEAGLLDRADAWRSGSLDAEGFKQALAGIDTAIRSQPNATASPLFAYVLSLTGQVARWTTAQLQAQRDAVIDAVEQLEDGRSRLDQMLGVHRLLESPKTFAAYFERAGLALDEHGPLTYRGTHAVGHRFLFSQPRTADG